MPLLLIGALLLAACAPAEPETADDLPTLAQLPTLTETPAATATETPLPTDTATPTVSATPTRTPTASDTPTLTQTPRPTRTPRSTATTEPTAAAQASSTAQVAERPVFATLTPVPPGSDAPQRPTSTGTPIILADVIITQRQLQEEVDRLRPNYVDVDTADLAFVAQGIDIALTTQIDGVFTTGTVRMTFDLVGGDDALNRFVQIGVVPPEDFVMSGTGEPSDDFVDVAYTQMFPLVGEAFNAVLNQRLGEGQHDLEFLRIVEDRMEISLLVPDPGT